MGDLLTYKQARPLVYLPPFHSLTKAIDSEYELTVACDVEYIKQMKTVMQQLQPIIPVRVGGETNKVLLVGQGNAEVFISPLGQKYDLCAGHALVQSRLGHISDSNG